MFTPVAYSQLKDILNSSINVYYSSISRQTHFMLLAFEKAGEVVRDRLACDDGARELLASRRVNCT